MSDLERSSGSNESGESTETQVSETVSVEKLIAETRAQRDADRADPANWEWLDPANAGDPEDLMGDPEPWTAEELAAMAADADGDQGGSADQGVAPEIDRNRPAEIQAAETGESAPLIVYDDTDPGALPTYLDFTAWDEDDADATPDSGSGTSDDPPAYRTPEDVREAFMSGKGVSEVREELANQPPGPFEDTTEMVRQEDGLSYERRRSEDTALTMGDVSSLRDELRRPEVVEQTQDVLETWGNWVADFHRDDPSGGSRAPQIGNPGSREVTGQVLVPVDSQIVSEQADAPDGAAALATAPLIGYMLADRMAQWASDKLAERRQARGE